MRRDSQPNLPYSSRAIEVQKEKMLIEVPFPVSLIFQYACDVLYMLLQLTAAFNIEELSLFGVTLALVAPRC